MGGLEHLHSPDRVNFLADKFDERTMYEWEYFRSKNTGDTYTRFFNFLLDRYDACRSSIARIKSCEMYKNNDTVISCQKCKAKGHQAGDCPLHRHDVHHSNLEVKTECQRCTKWVAREDVHMCPGCGRGTPKGQKIDHCLEHCAAYMRMSANQRSDCVEKAGWCPIHLLASHNLNSCTQKGDPKLICGIDDCKMNHHKTLHGSTTRFLANIISSTSYEILEQESIIDNDSDCAGQLEAGRPHIDQANVLLSVQSVETTSGNVNCFFDNGSTCCLITFAAARRLKLIGKPISITISTAIGEEMIRSEFYYVTLVDIHGAHHVVTVFGVEKISNSLKDVEIANVKSYFSPKVQDIWSQVDKRPVGEVDIIIGQNAAGLHPSEFESQENLKVMSSIFGSGYVLCGWHPLVKSASIQWGKTVSNIRLSELQKSEMQRLATYSINRIGVSVSPNIDFFEAEGLGVEPPRRCGNCRKCKDCSFRGRQLSQQEQYEYQIMESKVHFDEASKSFIVDYPFIEDPAVLPMNIGQVIKIAEREEKKLQKEGLMESFYLEFNKMTNCGALVELSKVDLELWKGPVHYVSLQHVLNNDSSTTPLRIVTNSSLSDRNGLSLNSILMKGPNTLSDQWEILTRWRMYETALCSDVTKAYYAIRTGETEKHVRRVVWRFGDQAYQWRIFGYCTVSFGDRPAAALLEIVIKKTAERFWEIDPEAAFKIMMDRYVDDFATGGYSHQILRFVGNEVANFQCDGTIPTILSKGSLQLKAIVTSGESNPDKINKLGNKVLGLNWCARTDTIAVEFNGVKVSTSKDVRMDSDPSTNGVCTPSPMNLTRRLLLSVINSIYDPLGLITPITIRLKVAFRNLFRKEPPLQWDDKLPPDDYQLWYSFIKMLVDCKRVTFPRSTRPAQTVGKCQLICYFDGSDVAFGCANYVRWVLRDKSVIVRLMNSKSRVTPLDRISTPRSELNGAVLASRLLLSTIHSLSVADELPEKVWIIGDSECTLASLEKVSGAFGEYFGNRIGEIVDNQAKIEQYCPVGNDGEWWFAPSSENAADTVTRLDAKCSDLDVDSKWQNGPQYLKLDHRQWPISRDFIKKKENYIPQMELLKRFRGIVQNAELKINVGIEQLIDPDSTNSWDELVRQTQVLLIPFQKFRDGELNATKRITDAKNLWFQSVMKETREALEKGKLKELSVQTEDGILVVIGRAKKGLQAFFGKNYLPVIMHHTRIAELIMTSAHWKDHAGRNITMAMARHEAWIINAKKLAKKIISGCVRCRFIRRLINEQKIAPLPDALQLPCPPFSHIGLDLCGPMIVKAMVNKRAKMKVWVVIFLCLNTKAVSIELAPGYSTEDFFLAYECHVSVHGTPSMVHSDRGSQLVAANRELGEKQLLYDWEKIAASTGHYGTNWKFAPAGGQWRNGAVEAFVKKFKHSFSHLYKDTSLNYAELLCAVRRIANIQNDRPVSAQRTRPDEQDSDFLCPLTPNMLITGRSRMGPPVEYANSEIPEERLSYIDELERAWWYQYKVQCFHSLVPTRKWRNAKRNVAPGDVVLIQYKGKSIPGTYRLGRVKDVELDDDNLVRTCNVMYKLVQPITDKNRNSINDVVSKEIRVPVQRLVLILPIEEQV